MSGQVGPEAAFCGEGSTAKFTRERTFSQMCGLVQAQRSGAAEHTQAHSTLISSLNRRQRQSGGCVRTRNSLTGR